MELFLQSRAKRHCFVGAVGHTHVAVAVKHGVSPKWLALANGLPRTKTCGPIPGGLILTHTHFGAELPVVSFKNSARASSLRFKMVSTTPKSLKGKTGWLSGCRMASERYLRSPTPKGFTEHTATRIYARVWSSGLEVVENHRVRERKHPKMYIRIGGQCQLLNWPLVKINET